MNDFDREWYDIGVSRVPIIVFGTKIMGEISKTTIESLGKSIECFGDNDVQKIGTRVQGSEVKSLEEIWVKYPKAYIVLATLNEKTHKILEKQISQKGDYRFIHHGLILYIYQIKVMGRNVEDREILFQNLKITHKGINLKRVNVSVTTKCTLNCRDCGALMPYFDRPKNFDYETVIRSIENLTSITDSIEELLILGGEPLLYSRVFELIETVSKSPQIGRIVLNTNGTIMISDENCIKLKKACTHIVISDYGCHSFVLKDLIKQLEKHKIFYEKTNPNDPWTDFGDFQMRERSNEENNELFMKCHYREKCHSIIDGKYFLCGRSGYGAEISKIPRYSNDFVDLLQGDLKKVKKELDNLINKKTAILACDYCDVVFNNPIEPAVQLKK